MPVLRDGRDTFWGSHISGRRMKRENKHGVGGWLELLACENRPM